MFCYLFCGRRVILYKDLLTSKFGQNRPQGVKHGVDKEDLT